jgi:dimethylhistidine N-methyltransferase
MAALAKITTLPEFADADTAAFAADVIAGLTATPKHIPPKYFYDAEGSHLFEEITWLPEYYLTRTERQILRDSGADIARLIPEQAVLVEFGSGACQKARILLDAAPQILAYVPIDISADFLARQAAELHRDYPRLAVEPVVADFTRNVPLPHDLGKARVGFFPGSTIGNFERHEAVRFLRHAARLLGHGALLIIGVDLVKDAEVLNAAYNDSAGVTERFNFNLLVRINRELGGTFDLKTFEHHAFFNRERHRIEMHLASIKRQKVKVAGVTIDFRAGETIHTENSYKYTPDSFVSLARGAGWSPVAIWADPQQYFSVHALHAR